MDYNAKMEELEALWSDSFELCKAMIASCKSGDQRLTGSILKELNAFIKQSVDFLKYREAEQAFSEEAYPDTEEDEALDKLLEEVQGGFDKDDEPLDIPDEGFPLD